MRQLRECRHDARDDVTPLSFAGIRQEERELVSTDAERVIAAADELREAHPEPLEHTVADGMTMLVVDLLEVVQVEADERQPARGLRLAAGLLELVQ